MQQFSPRLRVSDLTETNKILKYLKDIPPTINFHGIHDRIYKIQVWTSLDASFNILTVQSYGQTGLVTFLMVFGKGGENILQVVDGPAQNKDASATRRMAPRYWHSPMPTIVFFIKQAMR